VKVGAVTKLGKTKELLANLLRSLETTYILLDGLDECADKDQKQILMELSNLIPADSKAKENSPKLKILVCSRETKEIARKLNKVPQISLTNEDRYVSQDIASFVKSSLAELKDRFQDNIVDEIQDIVVKKADGKTFPVFSALL
jgi:Cdc6-like AAA superfamily ATPase